jgi:hypothetical protein
MNDVERRLRKFLFPVDERKVYFEDLSDNPKRTKEYKAIIRLDKNKLVSIQQDTYKLVSNYEVIMPLLDQLHKLDTRWVIDPSHSFVDDKRMRLQVTFPDLTLNDGKSDIALSLFTHNSYDGSEGVRMYWGAIRGICSNGMVFGQVLAKFYSKHTKGINLHNLKQQIEETYDQIPVIKERISILQRLEVTDVIKEEVKDKMGKKISDYITNQIPAANQWMLYNMITFYISHVIEQRLRAGYQMRASKLFKL